MTITSGRRKDGNLWVKSEGHYWSQGRNGIIHANYHGNPALIAHAPHPFKRNCCIEFEKLAAPELTGLQLLDEMKSDLEE